MRKKGIPSTLFNGAENEELRKKLKEDYIACLPIMELTLTKAVKDLVNKSYTLTERDEVYKLPKALEYLADQHGYRRALKEILKLLGEQNV